MKVNITSFLLDGQQSFMRFDLHPVVRTHVFRDTFEQG